MSFLVIIGGLAVALFVIAFFRSGRFGPAVLALSAGYIMAELWAEKIATTYQQFGADFSILAWHGAVYTGIVLLPGLAALLLSQKRQSIIPGILAHVAIALLTVAILLPLVSPALVIDSASRSTHDVIMQHRDSIITVILVLGVLDIVFGRLPKLRRHHKAKE